jgi:hypothetical protein
MTHADQLNRTIACLGDAMNTHEATVTDLAPHVTPAQARFIADAADWLREILAARPAIQPAKQWATPTEHRRAVAQRTGAAREFVGRSRRGRRNGSGPVTLEEQRAHAERMNGTR